jgi:HAE1 family hydrophobic/amphiphilic exporter-1
VTEKFVEKVEQICREVVEKDDIDVIVANIGITADFSAIFNPNTAQHTATVQVSLKEDHHVGSYEYMKRVRERIRTELPHVSAFFQSGGLVDSVLNLGQPDAHRHPDQRQRHQSHAQDRVRAGGEDRALPGVSDVLVPQDMDYPAIRMDLDRKRISELGLTPKEVTHNVITALMSNGLIAPTFWADPKSGNDYYLTVQYPEHHVKDFEMLRAIPIRAPGMEKSVRLDAVATLEPMTGPTEITHYQIRRIINLFVAPER